MNFNDMAPPPSTLDAMNDRQTQWLNEKPSSFNNENEYRPLGGDLVFFNFVATGNDGDQFIKNYKSHVFDAVSSKGNRYSTHRYCPVQSGETETVCALCAQGEGNVKERMSFWMYVTDILHKIMPREKQFASVNHEGQSYFHEPVNDYKVWHTSAWRESPWTDIVQLNRDYRGLNNFTARLLVTGEGLARRYKIYAMPNSPMLTPELYERAKAECESIPSILRKQLASAVQVAPPNPNQPQAANVMPFAVPGAVAPAFGFGQAAPIISPVNQGMATISPPAFAPPTGVAETLARAFGNQPTFEQAKDAPSEEPEHPFDIDEDTKRPMKGMF